MGIVGSVDRESYRKISRVRDVLHVPRDKFQGNKLECDRVYLGL